MNAKERDQLWKLLSKMYRCLEYLGYTGEKNKKFAETRKSVSEIMDWLLEYEEELERVEGVE